MTAPTPTGSRTRVDGNTTAGFTRVPPWSPTPTPGRALHETPVTEDLLTALHRAADDAGVTVSAVLLAAHAKVLSALSGDTVVSGGRVIEPGGRWVPWSLTAEVPTWRELLAAAETELSPARAESPAEPAGERAEPTVERSEVSVRTEEFAPARAEASAPARSEQSPPEPSDGRGPPDALLGTADLGRPAADGPVLAVALARRDGRPVLRVRFRTDRLDAEAAARVAHYHRAALEQLASVPDSAPADLSLVSEEERLLQIHALAGRSRPLPDRRFHELFEERAESCPDAIAAECAGETWTYRELNARANRLGRALLGAGMRSEDVVAVAAERGLDWMAAVLAVFKAGGVYMPVEPHFPPDRIARMLSRADCDLVLTAPGTDHLDRALAGRPGTRTLSIDKESLSGADSADLGVTVEGSRPAYVYFTSGSTGEPKGAVCEHAGMLNHLYAKIDDLRIHEGGVVAQTAPQCFDISLWQLVSALLVGGRTLIVEQTAILDVPRFLDTIAGGRAGVVQLVPSYLDVVLSALERRPRALPDLRCVSVTGEPLKRDLVRRWFAAAPGTRLVNAYGLTETSDDTNHEVMEAAPDSARVPLGRPIPNVYVYVVDQDLTPVPLGAPGEIVFSGVCVGRGYINDPERTRHAFVPDPHRPGERLYRSGDYGRWLPDGKLEFLGRRDTQVKIRGFRIETGEVENALLAVPGVRDAAVVVTPTGDRTSLVGFYTSDAPLGTDVLVERLARSLPAYMVPSALHRRDALDLTANGKVDKKALAGLAQTLTSADAAHEPPRTPTEKRLADAFATVLGLPRDRVGRRDHFFDQGGTSLSAVRLALHLDRVVPLPDVLSHPVLADLATLIDSRAPRPVPPTPSVATKGRRP
ncbi:non-ribosomal peptide synthetase [Streptomyces sp. Qhu_M48]|uniref:non-ribosomal peptide synthetase n=1 Tax=Streptomyces sp. Qhu_M48 TaxID=3435889 RepID=UPI003F50C361